MPNDPASDRTPVVLRTRILAAALGALLAAGPTARGQERGPVPTPEAHLGFRPGADHRLATWDQVVSYVEAVGRTSDRVRVRTLGETTEGRPYMAVFVSAPETVRDLDRYREVQQALHDPRRTPDDDARRRAVAEGKPVVVITCSIHSTETASTLMALELLHGLATRDDPATREVLDKTILVLVPSANPDGVDHVARWYERSRGRPWEGSGMPSLYHKYAGHDTNRDWFMLNLKETRLLTRLLYHEWFPTLLYDVHQMGRTGPRIFVPPFYDPVNPNLDPRVSQGLFLVGSHMAADLAAAGKRGVVFGAQYDNWWNGGNRTTPQRHNIVAVLTEAASVRMASPVFLDPGDLKGGARGFPDHRLAVNFADPWPGGWWRLRDIVDDELVCARALLTLAARYGPMFQANLQAMARDAVRRGETEPPYGWVVPRDQRDPGSAAAMVRILHDSGVEVRLAPGPLEVAGQKFPAGAWVLPAAQPYRAHLKDLMERQAYPTRLSAGGKAEAPYDVAGWTLPLQMGVAAIELAEPIRFKTEPAGSIAAPRGRIVTPKSDDPPNWYAFGDTTNDDARVRFALEAAGVELRRAHADIAVGNAPFTHWLRAGSLLAPVNANSRAVLERVVPTVSTRVEAVHIPEPKKPRPQDGPPPAYALPVSPDDLPWVDRVSPVGRLPLAVYQPWVPSMDEGWTRFVLESFGAPYTTVHDGDIRAGALRSYGVLLIPSINARSLRDGYARNESEPEYVGGLGKEGVAEIRRFVREGGRLVCLDASCAFAIEELGLAVRDVLKGLPTSEFYGPGSILRAEPVEGSALVRGGDGPVYVYFDESRAFDLGKGGAGTVHLRYARSDPLESGWLLGPSKLEGKAALVEVAAENGRVILFGFPPQHRGQTHGTFRLLINAVTD